MATRCGSPARQQRASGRCRIVLSDWWLSARAVALAVVPLVRGRSWIMPAESMDLNHAVLCWDAGKNFLSANPFTVCQSPHIETFDESAPAGKSPRSHFAPPIVFAV